MLFALSPFISEQQEQMQWVSRLQLLAPFTGRRWIPQDHALPRCYIPSSPGDPRSSHVPSCFFFFFFWMQKSDNFISSFPYDFCCVYFLKWQRLITCWEAVCCQKLFSGVFRVFFSLGNLKWPCNKYLGMVFMEPSLFCFLETQEALLLLITSVGMSQWC